MTGLEAILLVGTSTVVMLFGAYFVRRETGRDYVLARRA
jgi:hypothetical protein